MQRQLVLSIKTVVEQCGIVINLEAVLLSDGEDAEKALSAAEVVVPDSSVVLLASRVQDVYLYLKHGQG